MTGDGEFFGQLTKYDSETLGQFRNRLNEHYRVNSVATVEGPRDGDFCCCQYDFDLLFYRARIVRKYTGKKYIVSIISSSGGSSSGSSSSISSSIGCMTLTDCFTEQRLSGCLLTRNMSYVLALSSTKNARFLIGSRSIYAKGWGPAVVSMLILIIIAAPLKLQHNGSIQVQTDVHIPSK